MNIDKTREELRASREQLEFALRGANSGIWDWFPQENKIYFDDNYYKISGYTPHEFPCAYEEWQNRVHPEDIDQVLEAISQTIDGKNEGFTTKFRFKKKNGDWMWILGQGKVITYDADGAPVRIAGMHTDIDESKKGELALKNSEARLASILRVAPTGIGVTLDRVIHRPNRRFCEMTGYNAEELEGLPARKLYLTEEVFEWVGREKYRQISHHGTGTVETQMVRKDGSLFDVLLSSTPINPDNLGEGITFTALDITDRKQAERNLRESEEHLRTILNSIGDAVIATDFQQKIINLNRVAEKLTGWSENEALEQNLKDVFQLADPEDGKPIKNFVHHLQTSDAHTAKLRHAQLKMKNGGEHQVACSASPIKDTEGSVKGTVLVFRDIGEELRLHSDLQRIQTLESIGILAGGIAHDFNNILMGLFGNITMAKRKLDTEHPAFKNLEKAENSAERAKNLTGKLLTFAKGGEPIRDHVSLTELMKDVVLFDLTGSNVKAIFDIPSDLWTADVDKGQIQQVFSNLTTNANQAMPDGGKLFINLQNYDNTDGKIKNLSPGKYLKVSVRDTGTGINKQDLGKIFDPYFSTKQTGSGLGLATVYSIIHRHKGQIEVDSSPGQGTTFTLLIPASDKTPVEGDNKPKATRRNSVDSARILVMDDELVILDLVSEMLESLGHKVETATDCEKTLRRYRQNEFDLLILDLTIPGGPGGLETLKEIHAINSQAKALVASGYAEDPVMSRYEEYGFKGVVCKPYSIEELQHAIETALTG
ncbi:PAS domain S-box-containing protein [Malonomonas rubra DSM 5091]|uniref:histidine kinase n=1 Tax=Malonomonas rubra DSM 5091 TaxID=1122189 RepID=A0A1M6JGR8_MALRU|nr:PAS domain S-box protein [Malonomonas rubra]SHJ45893.1 PAS domain S-box-containing protein [Malonomonas rubra DSM 5091]